MARKSRLIDNANSGPNGQTGEATAGQIGGVSDTISGVGNEANESGNGIGGNTDGISVDPESAAPGPAAAAGTAETAKVRRRGRPPGSKNKSSSGAVELDAKQLASQIQGLHIMFAMLTNQPIFQLSADGKEAETLAGAIANVGKHYNVTFDGPRAAIIQLVAVGGMIYLPRILTIRNQNIAARAQQPAPPQSPEEAMTRPSDGGVVDFTGERTFRKNNPQH